MSNPILWTDHTVNPGIYGCEEVSPACANCYAASMAHRLSAIGVYPDGITTRRTSGVHWSGVVRVNYAAIATAFAKLPKRKPARVFVTSMADLFHADVPEAFHDAVFAEMESRPNLTFQVLTKRPERMARYATSIEWPANVWAGTTVEDQRRADDRIPHLLRVPAGVRFLSMEPLLGAVDLAFTCFNGADSFGTMPGIHWVITGGESGAKARPSHPDWFRSIRDACAAAGVAFHFKQWGEYVPRSHTSRRHDWHAERTPDLLDGQPWRIPTLDLPPWGTLTGSGQWFAQTTPFNGHDDDGSGETYMYRVGKHAAGRLLDGRTHDDFPDAGTTRAEVT